MFDAKAKEARGQAVHVAMAAVAMSLLCFDRPTISPKPWLGGR